MKKILFLIHDLSYGGAEKVLVNLANNMDKTKFDVTIQTLFDCGVNKQNINSDVNYIGGCKYMFRGNTTLMKLFTPKSLCNYFIKDEYDIVISYLEGSTSRILSAYKGKKVAWIHSTSVDIKTIAAAFKSVDEAKICYSKFNKIICVSNSLKENFLSLLNVSTPLDVLYNTNESKQIIEKSLEKVDDIKFNDNHINIISVGKIIDVKGYDRLLEIHKKLLDNGIKNHIYLLGVGDLEHSLMQRAKELNVSNTFTIIGFRDNPYKYVSKADLYVCSSRSEGFSTAVTEALIVGTPVVSTNCSGAYELLGYNNEYGIVTENNENSLYTGIKQMLKNKETLLHYKKQAEIRGLDFNTEKTVKAVENMLENL